MKFSLSRLVASSVLLALVGSVQVEAAAPVWRITGADGAKLYLGGSLHALRRADYPLPAAFYQAFEESARLIFEVKAEPAASQRLLKSGEYPRGDSLKNHVDPRTYDYLKKVFALLGVPEAKFAQYRPWVLTVMLWSPSLRGLSEDLGIEGHLTQRARTKKKPISGLVSVEEHLGVFTGLSERQSEAVLLLTFIPRASAPHATLVNAWKRGEADSFWRAGQNAFEDYPAFGERLIEARNRRWIPTIEGLLRSGQTCFVVVGMGHMGGPEGLLPLLRKRGYRIDQM